MLFRSFAAVLAAAAAVQASDAPKKQEGGFEVVIVYAKPEGGCTEPPTACKNVPAGTLPQPTHIIETLTEAPSKPKPTTTQSSQTPESKQSSSATYTGPIATLKPAVHWSINTNEVKNVVPVPADEANKLYYGLNDPTQSGNFAYLTYYFNQPSVNLDQCGHVKDIVYSDAGLAVTFDSDDAFEIAQDTWSADDGMILITYTEGCGDYDKEDRCYFKVTGLSYDVKAHTVLATGTPGHPGNLVSSGESEWGWWTPDAESKAAGMSGAVVNAAGDAGASYSWNPSAPTPSPQPQRKTRSGCVAPADQKDGLPTACFGKLFDLELDDQLQLNPLSEEQKAFLDKVSRRTDVEGTLVRRWGWFKDALEKVKEGVKDTFKKVETVVENVIDDIKDVVDDIATFSGDFDHDFSYKLPDPENSDPLASMLLGGLTQASSPWGPAILLKSFGVPEGVTLPAGVDAHLNVYCVNCGVSGTVRIAGRATWKPTEGVTEGQIELFNDMQLMLQVGLDATVSYKYEFETELFGIGLPGLSFGVITIGPYISVGSKLAFEAAANGRLLTGAELGLQNAHVLIDLVNPENTKAEGWTPSVKPILEVEGEVKLTASLGLPVGLKCGVKIATFELSAGIVDEPSIKGIAQVAASIGLNATGQWEAGFKETLGCTGIVSQLSWRNQLSATVTGLSPFVLHDTGDNLLAQGCIELPHVQPIRRKMIGGNKYHDAAARVARSATAKSMVVDVTGNAKAEDVSEHATYAVKTLPPTSYKGTDGYDYSTITNPSGKNLLASCSNGNLYSFAKGFHVPSCSAMWASVDTTLVTDGTKRVMHYYSDTMAALGVSRLRIRDKSTIPESGAVVAWAPYSEKNEVDSNDYLYLAVDEKDDVFYPVVCTFDYSLGDEGSKVFLVADPEAGVETLKRIDVQNTVTGGTVKDCYPLSLKKGVTSEEDYAKYGPKR